MKAVFLDFATMGPGLDVDRLCDVLPELEIFDVTRNEQVADRIQGAEIVLGNKIQITEMVMQDNPGMRFVGLTATGTDNVDIVAAEKRGVAVANIRAYCTESVAEHVFACLLNLTRNLEAYSAAVRAGEWQKSDDFCLLNFPVRELSAMRLGIIGYGELGKGVARIGRAFGMDVIVAARAGGGGPTGDRVSFDELLQRSDVISLHCPLNDNTRGLFGVDEFRKMKADAILVNTARGGLVDSAALVAALRDGEIGAAAIDVLATEPPVDGDPLLDYDGPNLVVTPHIAWGSNEARQSAIDELTANVEAFIAGRERNRVV